VPGAKMYLKIYPVMVYEVKKAVMDTINKQGVRKALI